MCKFSTTYIHLLQHVPQKDTTYKQLIQVSIYTLYLTLLREYMVVLRRLTNAIVPDLGGGPVLYLPGFSHGFL